MSEIEENGGLVGGFEGDFEEDFALGEVGNWPAGRGAGRPAENHTKVRIVETGEIFKNYREAAEAIDGNRGCVLLCLKGWRPSHKGLHFEYVEDEKSE